MSVLPHRDNTTEAITIQIISLNADGSAGVETDASERDIIIATDPSSSVIGYDWAVLHGRSDRLSDKAKGKQAAATDPQDDTERPAVTVNTKCDLEAQQTADDASKTALARLWTRISSKVEELTYDALVWAYNNTPSANRATRRDDYLEWFVAEALREHREKEERKG